MLSTTYRNTAKMSAAGSGKTYDICKSALERATAGHKVLITTYTNRGVAAIQKEIRKQNEGILHPRIIIKTWFTFLMSELIKPYQHYLTGEVGAIKAFDFSQTYGFVNYAKSGTKKRYITGNKKVRSNEGSSLACLLNKLSEGKVIRRLEEIYDTIYFDEIQDMAGDDMAIITLLINSSIGTVFCGDNKQATFTTHNTKKRKRQTGKNIWEFFIELEKAGLVNIERNLSSRRFNHQICSFANRVFPAGESITTIMDEETVHDGVFLIDAGNVRPYMESFFPQVLRYDKNTDTYGYNAVNFGACKGETFARVLIFPNRPLVQFVTKGTALSSPEKYYVAVTRPKYSIAFVLEHLPKALRGYEETSIECGKATIRALKYTV